MTPWVNPNISSQTELYYTINLFSTYGTEDRKKAPKFPEGLFAFT